jgi:hypothetical protein
MKYQYFKTEFIKDWFLEIINASLVTGQFPNSWKTSIVIPIPKVQNMKKCEEFRPINKLPIYENNLENIVKDQFMHYCKKNLF